MKRSSFKKPQIERNRTVPEAIPVHLRRSAVYARMDVPAAPPVEKFEYVRSRKLLDAIKTLPCQHCGAPAPSDPAHSNQQCHGKGKSIKASDVFTAALCRECHREIDQGHRLTYAERIDVWSNAWRKTVATLLREGLWPMEIKIPDTRRMN